MLVVMVRIPVGSAIDGERLEERFRNRDTLMTEHVCPVGALTSRDFRFKARVWFLRVAEERVHGLRHRLQQLIDYDPRDNTVYRLRPRDNAGVNQYWMCDDGMMSYKRFDEDRIDERHPAQRRASAATSAEALRGGRERSARVASGKLAVVLSAQHRNEDNFALVQARRASSAPTSSTWRRSAAGKATRSCAARTTTRTAPASQLVAGGEPPRARDLLQDVAAARSRA